MQTYQGKKLPYHSNLMVHCAGFQKHHQQSTASRGTCRRGDRPWEGVLFSDDSNVFLQALRDLGFYRRGR